MMVDVAVGIGEGGVEVEEGAVLRIATGVAAGAHATKTRNADSPAMARDLALIFPTVSRATQPLWLGG